MFVRDFQLCKTYHSTTPVTTKMYCDYNSIDEYIWRPTSISKLTPIIFYMELTHLGSEASICCEVYRFYHKDIVKGHLYFQFCFFYNVYFSVKIDSCIFKSGFIFHFLVVVLCYFFLFLKWFYIDADNWRMKVTSLYLI